MTEIFDERIALLLKDKPPKYEELLKQLIAIGQLNIPQQWEEKDLISLLEKLVQIDTFYDEMGGIVGYQEQILELLKQTNKTGPKQTESISYHPPESIDISEQTAEVGQALLVGLEALSQIAVMVPLGGAADRLHLVDEKTGYELPAAKLCFAGRSLLATIVRDLQAKEYLYYKVFGEQITTPLAFMTSEEKENHRHILDLMNEFHWFGRPKESVRFFMQPMVPVVSETGDWCWVGPFKPLMKPGGHGAIWKLARDFGIFDWLKQMGRKKALIRQINNPLAGIDYGILAFLGLGIKDQKVFGFASCPRRLDAAEGVNVLLEKKMHAKSEIVLTNVEYCDFEKLGLEALLKKQQRFSSNTNILFADLEALESAVEVCPYPGLLMNLKQMSYKTESGEQKQAKLARLESTMQNIADAFIEEKQESFQTKRTYVTYNHRHKTISTAKKGYISGGSLQETPEKCFYDLLFANRELLQHHCQWTLPEMRGIEEYLKLGPDFVFLYHPALGPLYSIISQKLRKGKLALGSELQLEIADVDCEGLDLDGSLVVTAKQPMGHFDPFLRYSERIGRCRLKNVTISNRGVNWNLSCPFWKNQFIHQEKLEVILNGHSEFIAEDLSLIGSYRFEVEEGESLRLFMKNGELAFEKKQISPHPFWHYIKSGYTIKLRGQPAATSVP